MIPAILNQKIYDDIYIVTDEEAIQTAKDLASREGIMCEFQRHQCGSRPETGGTAGQRKDRGDGAAGYSGTLFFHTAV